MWSSDARRKRLAPRAVVLHIHIQQIQQGNPLGIYPFFVIPPPGGLENDSHAFRRHMAQWMLPLRFGMLWVKLLYTSNLFVMIGLAATAIVTLFSITRSYFHMCFY